MISFSYSKDKRNSNRMEMIQEPRDRNSLGHFLLRAAIVSGLLFAIFYTFSIIRSLAKVLQNSAASQQENWPVALPSSNSKNELSTENYFGLDLYPAHSAFSNKIIDDLIRRVESLEKTEDGIKEFRESVSAQLFRSQIVRFMKVGFREIPRPLQKLRLVHLSPRRRGSESGFGLGAIHSAYFKLLGKDPNGLLGSQLESPPLCSSKGKIMIIYQAKKDLTLSVLLLKLPGVN